MSRTNGSMKLYIYAIQKIYEKRYGFSFEFLVDFIIKPFFFWLDNQAHFNTNEILIFCLEHVETKWFYEVKGTYFLFLRQYDTRCLESIDWVHISISELNHHTVPSITLFGKKNKNCPIYFLFFFGLITVPREGQLNSAFVNSDPE